MTLISRPSVAGGAASRETLLSYDASGDLIQRTESGMEAGAPFSLITGFTPNEAGRTAVIDPPGFGTADQTTFAYNPARGDLIPTSRTDPLVGTTLFEHDAFNRRTGVTDPNGVLSEIRYDALDRVTHQIQRSDDASSPGDPIVAADLVTEHVYGELGDLVRTILPEGNVIEYGHDAAGRLVSIERKPDAATAADPAGEGNGWLRRGLRGPGRDGDAVRVPAISTAYGLQSLSSCRPECLNARV